jgi:hypothetical protein
MREFFGVIELFCILTMVVVTGVYLDVIFHRTMHRKKLILLHNNFKNKIKLSKSSKELNLSWPKVLTLLKRNCAIYHKIPLNSHHV